MNLPGVKSPDIALNGKSLIEQSPLPTFIIDSQGVTVMVNEAFLKAYNVSQREIILGTNALTEPANVEHSVVDYMREALSGKVVETPEVDFTTPYGERRITRSRLFPVFDGAGAVKYVVVMHEDITERRLAEERCIEVERESAAARERVNIMEGVPDVIFVLDEDMNLLDLNQTAVQRTGYFPGEVSGRSVLEFISGEDGEKMSKGIEEVIREGQGSIEGKLVTKDGKEIPHLWSASPYKNKNGSSSSTRIICVGRNIIDLKKSREREEFLNSLLRHDVSNKSQITQSCLELLMESDLTEEQRELLEGALNCSREEIEIIKKVRALGEVKGEEGREIGINSVIRDVVEDNKHSASRKDMKIEIMSSEHDQNVIGGQLLKELFNNLIGNSIKHSGGSIIRIDTQEMDGRIICTVEDDGRGMPQEEKKKMFERGYKKGEKSGSGLGMYLVKEIAESYNGEVVVKDSPLGGLKFEIHLEKADN